MNPWLSPTIVQALGWTLVHFLWQGLVIAVLLATGLRMFRSRPAHYKYLAACAAMALMALAPLVTFRLVLSQPEPLPAITPVSAKISPVRTSEVFTLAQPTRTANPGTTAAGLFERLNHLLPWLVLGWLAGVCTLSCRLFVGWLQVRRLRHTSTHPLPSPWPERLAVLAQRLGVNRSIQLLQSALIEVPTVIGWLRPVILLPASCLTGLTPGQLEAIIAHELAHIRRHDYLVNLLQSVIETLLFYHPAVWWVSRRIREERENCCDDLAVAVSGDLVGYARALATLEELRPASAQLMLAAGGAPLLQRIRRLAGQPERSAGRASWPVAGIAVLLVLGVLAAGRMEHRAAAAPQLTDETTTNKPPPLEIRTFHVDPKTFIHGLESALGSSFPDGTFSSNTSAVAAAIRRYFASAGVDLSTNTGDVVIFNDLKGRLTIRGSSQDLDKIEAAISILNTSQPPAAENKQAAPTTNAAKPPEVNIKAKFVEISMKDGETNWSFFKTTGIDGGSNAAHTASFTGILSAPQFRATINALQQHDGTEVLTTPEVTTESGRQAQIQVGDMQKIVLPGKGTNASTTNMFFGETLDVVATVSSDKKSIDMRLIPSISEFKGYVKVSTNPAVLPLPSYELRQTTANVTTWDGQTVVIGGYVTASTNVASQPVKKELLVFVTATLINPDGTLYHTDEERKALLAGPPPQPDPTNR